MNVVANKRAKRVDTNQAMFIPNNQKLTLWSIPNHSLKVEELKGNIVTNKKVVGMMERC